MEVMQGVCEYCGQVQNVRALDQTEADQIASDNCNCPESKLVQKKKRVFEDIEEISQGNAYAPPLGYKTVELLKLAAEEVIKTGLSSATFKVGQSTINIKETSSKIKVTRRDVSTTSAES